MLAKVTKLCLLILVLAGFVRVFDPIFGMGLFSATEDGKKSLAKVGKSLYLARGCIGCHGSNGSQPVFQSYPKLNGQNEDYLYNQMLDIKAGIRLNQAAGLMQPYLKDLRDDDMRAIAIYLSRQ